MPNSLFFKFASDISSITLPENFTFPFYYQPHKLAVLAAKELQEDLSNNNEWSSELGINHYINGVNVGKMFGVLVVQNKEGELGYLRAFSGKMTDTNHLPGYVPPLVDLLKAEGFYRLEESNINEINAKVKALEQSDKLYDISQRLSTLIEKSDLEINSHRQLMKTEKSKRDALRKEMNFSDKGEELLFLEDLKKQSLKFQFEYKVLKREFKEKIEAVEKEKSDFLSQIINLKNERKLRSSQLQKQMFNQYQFLNFKQETKSLLTIFENTAAKIPPSGAGECAAPKLLQYAYENQLKPIALAEFWWGKSPKSEIRTHKNFYPSCRSKCEPILGHMLDGLSVDPNPLLEDTDPNLDIEIIYNDPYIAVINKPAEFLSVPGNRTSDSVYTRMLAKFPEATGPIIVHRLDMSTSGLMVIAKNKNAHKFIQKQFIERKVKKHYYAVLDGVLKESQGEVDLPLRVDLEDRPRQLVCYEHGKRALTQFRVLKIEADKTHIEFTPITGRTHQLRVHSAHSSGLNMAIIGDDIYGKPGKRLCLHAKYLEFKHPESRDILKFDLAIDFEI